MTYFIADEPWLASRTMPRWDGRALCFCGRLLAVFKGAASVIGRILNALDEAGWPPFIPDPIQGGGDHREQLHNAIKNLNRKLGRSPLRFYLDRTQSRVYWEVIPKT
jgi:hypothetical protein